MTTFRYRAKDSSGKGSSGIVEAENKDAAARRLFADRLYPFSIEESPASRESAFDFGRRVTRKEILFFTRQLADLLDSNVPLLRALGLLEEQAEQPAFRNLLHQIADTVRGGESLSGALKKRPELFSDEYVSLTYAGETGGMLDATLNRLASALEQEDDFRSQMISAIAYPAFVMLIGALTIVFLMLFVVPRLSVMFDDTGQGLPPIARALSAISGLMSSASGLAASAAFISSFIYLAMRAPKTLRQAAVVLLFKLPVWGSVMKKATLSRFTRTLAMLLAGGVPILRALDIGASLLRSTGFYPQTQKIIREIETGAGFSESAKRSGIFPIFVCQMIAIGEEANTLEKVLEKVADTYEREAKRAMKLATSLLEPTMILLVGSVIGVIVIGMLLPIFQISTFVK